MARVELNLEVLKERLEDAKREGRIAFNERQLEKWYNAGYGIVGHHSAVQICHWTKSALNNRGGCYKVRFYGIDAHRCAQISPVAAWCSEGCVFCWRPMEWYSRVEIKAEEVDDPEEIVNGVVEERKRLLSGFLGSEKANKKLVKEAYYLFPSHWAISLSGEPTMYPKLPELIKLLKSKVKEGVRSIFLVSNGQHPEMIEKMWKEDALPTQLYISLTATNEEMFKRVNRSVFKDGWQRLMRTMELLSKLPTRRVIRLTVIKGLNDSEEDIPRYAEIIDRSKADYVEVKSYMYLGQSRQRLKEENMAEHPYIREFALKLLKYLKTYHFHDEHFRSRIVLLKRNDSPYDDYIPHPDASRSLKKQPGPCRCGYPKKDIRG